MLPAALPDPVSFSAGQSARTRLSANTLNCLPILAQASPPERRQIPKRRRPSCLSRSMTGRTARWPRHSIGSRSAAHGREEAAQKKEQERRDRATAAAEAALEEGKRIHQANLADLEKAQQALDKRKDEEAARWQKQEVQLESALRRA